MGGQKRPLASAPSAGTDDSIRERGSKFKIFLNFTSYRREILQATILRFVGGVLSCFYCIRDLNKSETALA